jgi:hypothetical protein
VSTTLRDELLGMLMGVDWASTFHLANVMKRTLRDRPITRRVYRELCRMERDGLIRRHKKSAVNNICWEVVQ